MDSLVPQPSPDVAVLDDDIQFIRMVERVLKSESIGIYPVTTLDLEEAARVIGESGCHLALIDIFMYGNAAGFDLISRLRADPATASLPILVTSGAQREVARRVEFLQENHCELLLKPFTPDELIRSVRKLRAPAAKLSRTRSGSASTPLLRPSAAQVGAFAQSSD